MSIYDTWVRLVAFSCRIESICIKPFLEFQEFDESVPNNASLYLLLQTDMLSLREPVSKILNSTNCICFVCVCVCAHMHNLYVCACACK